MSAKFELNAEARAEKGTGASRRLRRAGKVPAVVYGAGKEPQMLQVDHDPLYNQLRNEAFLTSIITIKVDGSSDQAVLRDVQLHPFKPRVQHLDLQRISATEKLHMRVPLHFVGQDASPGVKQQGGVASHLMTDVEVTCLPKDLPEYLEIDMSNLSIGQSVHLSDIKLPNGIALTALAHGNDLAVAAISMVRATVEAEAAAAAPAAEAPAAEAKKDEKEAGKDKDKAK